jgi:hypothetical protein
MATDIGHTKYLPSTLIGKKGKVELDVIEEFGNYERLVNRNEGVVSRVMVAGKTIFENEDFVPDYGKSYKYGRFLEKNDYNSV